MELQPSVTSYGHYEYNVELLQIALLCCSIACIHESRFCFVSVA